MTTPTIKRFALPILLVLVAVGIWAWVRSSGEAGSGGTEPATAGKPIPSGSAADAPATKTNRGKGPRTTGNTPADSLDRHFAALSKASTAEEARAQLEELRAFLSGLEPDVAAELIERFLGSGRDTDLPLEFGIGEGGFLETPPTFRVALLDALGWVHPEQAAALGRQILSAPTTPDEWAVALRNVGKVEQDDPANTFLREKTEELLQNPEWQEKPSVGYLNAFDVLVHTGATGSTPLLSGFLQRKDRRDLAHASFLTLDRLTQRQPVAMLRYLNNDRDLQKSRPEMVAQRFARADLREPDQRDAVRTWLLDPARTPKELTSFAGIFPNNNYRISKNLLTANARHTGSDLRKHDRSVLILVTQWQHDPAFEPVRPHLDTMARRLQSFTSIPAP